MRHLATTQTIHCGFDPTADSLHIGSLIPLLTLRRFQLHGHRVVAIIGGATGMIGDPSGKSSERNLISHSQTSSYGNAISDQIASIIDLDDSSGNLVNNLEWIRDIDLISFLQVIGKHFSVNRMLESSSVKNRITREGDGISYTEFSYQLLQAYDTVHCNKQFGSSVQIGGNDQWGNITAGIELSRKIGAARVYGLTLPLVTKSDGGKFGKTESGNIWLSADKTSVFDFYQFWMNVADEDVEWFLRIFTLCSLESIAIHMQVQNGNLGIRYAQRMLAFHVTSLVPGEILAKQCETLTSQLYSEKELTEDDFVLLLKSDMARVKIESDTSLIDCLVVLPSVPSKSAAIRLIESGSVKVNNEKITDKKFNVLNNSKFALIKNGKKEFVIVYRG